MFVCTLILICSMSHSKLFLTSEMIYKACLFFMPGSMFDLLNSQTRESCLQHIYPALDGALGEILKQGGVVGCILQQEQLTKLGR